MREALRERELMTTRLAPHLVKPVPFLYPLTHHGWERPYVAAGLALYDTMGGHSSLPRPEAPLAAAALRMFPGLRARRARRRGRYYDAQADDARHTLTVARTAARYGAVVRSSTAGDRLRPRVRPRRRRAGARHRGRPRDDACRAGVVLNCTGVWTDELQALSGGARAVPGAGVEGRAHRRAARRGSPATPG